MIRSLGRTLWLQAFILVGLTYVVYLSLKSLVLVPEEVVERKSSPSVSQFDYRGVINIHTAATGGALSGADLVSAAQNAGLDWIVVSDLNTGVPSQLQEGRNRTLMVMLGAKYDYLGGRVIALNPDRLSHPESLGQAQTTIADILSEPPLVSLKDLLLFEGTTTFHSQVFQSSLQKAIGEEVVNLRAFLLSRWAAAPISSIWSLMIYPFNFPLALLRLFADLDLNHPLWDSRWIHSRAVGLLGHDVLPTQSEFGWHNDVDGQTEIFRFASVHLLTKSELTGDFASDQTKLLKAIAARQSYFAIDALGPTTGFRFLHQKPRLGGRFDDEQVDLIGAQVSYNERGRFVVEIPRRPKLPFEVVLIRNGQPVMTSNSEKSVFVISEPGVYRAVVRLFTTLSLFDGGRWVPWIIANPIEILKPREKPHRPY